MVEPANITRSSQTLKAANGTIIPILGEVTMPMKIGRFETSVNGLVSEHVAEVMLGIDWLTTNSVVWEFDKARIALGGEFHRLYARTGDGQWCRRVSLQQDTVIPPRSQMDVVTRFICKPWKEGKTDVQWGYRTYYDGAWSSRLTDADSM